ncbi:MAG: hypothetical protein ACT4PO_03695 [Actinomycetota bacterium]
MYLPAATWSFAFGAGVNRGYFVEGPGEHVVVGVAEDFPEGQIWGVQTNGISVLIVWQRSTCTRSQRFATRAGPLDEGLWKVTS